VKLIFWHPHDAGHVMTLEKPEEFYVIHNGKKKPI
jgi:cobalt/nickel transport protein